MNRELIEQKLLTIQEDIQKLIDDAYICGYKDGYFECMCHKGLAMNKTTEVIYQDSSMSASKASLKYTGGM